MRKSVFLIGFLTTSDNMSGDVHRLAFLLFTVAYIFLSAWRGGFEPISWATGAAALMGGSGVGLLAKARTEPHEREQKNPAD